MTRDDIIDEFGIACPHYEPCDCLVDGADFMVDEILKLRAAIDRVRALHKPEAYTTWLGATTQRCTRCCDESGYSMPYPCPTIRALNDEDV